MATPRHGDQIVNIEPNSSLVFTEFDQIFGTAADTITSLMRISMVIRDATPRDRYLRAEKSTKTPFLTSFDIDHVGHKFPKVNSEARQWLKKRLGCAITQRRQYLKYCRDHHDKFNQQPKAEETDAPSASQADLLDSFNKINTSAGAGGGTDTVKSAPTSALAITDASTLQVSKLKVGEITDENISEIQSQTSYASTVQDEYGESRLEAPKLADITSIFPFECPYCWTIQELKTEHSWR